MNEKKQEPVVETQEEKKDPKEEQRAEPSSNTGLPKTQEELDALIENRIKREYKKWNKQQVQQPVDTSAQKEEKSEKPADGAVFQKELIEARAQLEAFKNGVRADIVEDAVYLAIREVDRNGDDLDEDSIREALQIVLKRHPSWKNDEKQRSGIKVGADAEPEDKNPGKPSMPTGKVIF